MTEETDLLSNIFGMDRIQPGDTVESRHGDGYQREHKVKKGKGGNLIVKYQVGKYWYTDDLPPEKFHQRWRKVTASPAVRFVKLLLSKMREDSVHKRPGLIRQAIELAVESQMRFDVDDFPKLTRHCSFYGEDGYRLVVKSGNESALAALEKHMDRVPFWYDDPAKAHLGGKERLYVGAYFLWDDLHVKVTSFKDKNSLIACHQVYEDNAWKTRRVFRISRDDLARFTKLRHKVLVMSAWTNKNRPFIGIEFSYLHKLTGETVCTPCRDKDERQYLDYTFEKPEILELTCSRCGVMLYTSPDTASRVEALETAEAIAASENFDAGSLARWLRHVGPLADMTSYLERIIAVGEKAGIVERD